MRVFALAVVAAAATAALVVTPTVARAQEGTQPVEPPTSPATEAPADPPKTETPVVEAPKPIETPAEKREPANDVKPVEAAGGSTVTHDPQDKRAQCPKNTLLCWQTGNAAASVAVWPKLRVRPGFEYVDADPQIAYIGENDGFILDSARLGIEGNVSDLMRFRLSFDTQRLPEDAPNQAVVPLVAAPRDAYVAWTPSRWFMLQAGQQNVPSDYEGGDVDADIPFTRRSVMARGVRAGHGNAVDGLSPDRQVGVVIGSTDGAALGDIPLEYRLGIANGNGINIFGNDNGLPALYLRLGSGFGDLVRVGVGGRYNPRTVGTLPNLYTEADAVGFADVALTVAGAEFVATAVGRQTALTTFIPDASNPAGTVTGFGMATWLGYTFGLGDLMGAKIDAKPAIRWSFYDPSSAFATDQLMETTIGVRLDGDRTVLPLSFFLDYVFLTELGDVGNNVPARDLANNRLTALFQIEM
jgi:hypothetical protein